MGETREESWRFIRKVFAAEIPEVASGVVEIRAIARIPGVRTKVAVQSLDPDVDGVAACLGERNRAIQAIVARLDKERVDLFPWSDSPEKLITRALAPAKVHDVVLDPTSHQAHVTVTLDQLPSVVGPDNQNILLAAELTGWHLSVELREDAA